MSSYTPEDGEAALFTALREHPDDDATRQVYADWLEQHGFETRASFLRLEAREPFDEQQLHAVATPADASWRSLISRPPISRCGVRFGFECTKRWDALDRTDRDDVRHCTACDKPVYFCTTVDEAHQHGMRRECIAIDASLVRGAALTAYDAATRPTRPTMKMGALMIEPSIEPPIAPPIAPPPEKAGLFARLTGWFRRT